MSKTGDYKHTKKKTQQIDQLSEFDADTSDTDCSN